MARPSRSLKLLLPRLLEEPPLIDGPGPSLAVRSVRMRKGPLLEGGRVDSRNMSFLFKGHKVIEANGLASNMHFSPYVSFVARSATAAAVALPAVAAVPGRAVVRHVWYRGSDANGALVHGHGPALVPVPAVHVAEVAARRVRRWRRLGPADRLEALGVALEGRVVPVRSRPSLLRLWLAIKAVASVQTGPRCQTGQRSLNRTETVR